MSIGVVVTPRQVRCSQVDPQIRFVPGLPEIPGMQDKGRASEMQAANRIAYQ